MTYTHPAQEQRYQIYALLKMEHTQNQIATAFDVDKSTISRELRRNPGRRGYRPRQISSFTCKLDKCGFTRTTTPKNWLRKLIRR